MQKQNETAIVPEKKDATARGEDAVKRLHRILDATSMEKPKPEDLQDLRTLLKEIPELWKIAGDFSQYAIDRMLEGAAKQSLVKESAKHGLEVLQRDLGIERAPALERILIENVGVCWLQLKITQTKYEANTQEASLRVAEYWERRLNATNARYLRACETLARVRRLSKPGAVQVNIGANQVNVAQSAEQKQTGAGATPQQETKTVESERPKA